MFIINKVNTTFRPPHPTPLFKNLRYFSLSKQWKQVAKIGLRSKGFTGASLSLYSEGPGGSLAALPLSDREREGRSFMCTPPKGCKTFSSSRFKDSIFLLGK
uniref:Uncharacterized protein n=1 Tax=Morchella importuna TaxID=1174673 RepID=A0A650AFA2_9PEZI|nr:hypothetical protein [Morchella importuna]QGN66715.1 hypothetical protein [Morchella importuna]